MYSYIDFSVACLNIILAILLLVRHRKKTMMQYLAFFCFSVGAWAFFVAISIHKTTPVDYINLYSKILYLFGNLVGVTFLLFSILMSEWAKGKKKVLTIITLAIISFLSFLYIFTGYVVTGAEIKEASKNIVVLLFHYGPYKIFFDVTLWASFLVALILQLAYVYKKIKSPYSHTITWYTLLGTYTCLVIGGFTNVVLPIFDITEYIWVGPASTVIWVGSILLGTLKSEVFGFRTVITELFGVCLIIFSLWFFIASLGEDVFPLALGILIFNMTASYLSVLSVRKEIETKHLIETQAKKIEEANIRLKSLDKLKSEFISLATHQLRSPLTVIKGYASTLTDGVVGDLTPKQRDLVHHIYTAATGLANVVEDFLNVSKIEQGGMKYAFALVDVREIVKDLSSDMKIIAEDKGLRFESNIDENNVYTIEGDSTKIKQVFLNTIDNSIKYTKEGFVKVSLSQNALDKTMKFSVSDSGIGISEETKQKLFTKFGRGSAGSTLNTGGSGLGLYLAQAIVEAHKGRMEVLSDGEGKGATFSVYLPLS